jgi:uncharacterized protein (TIGR02996 family)
MTDHDALLAAVLAEPDNDLPRLVFADWLEETSHPAHAARAQFIRLQIEAERHPAKSARRFECTRQAEELRPNFRDEWDRVFPPGELSHTTVGRRRGFVEEVETGRVQLRESGNVMFAIAPVLSLQLHGPPHATFPTGDWTDLREMEFLTRLVRLRIGPSLWEFARSSLSEGDQPARLVQFFECPFLTGLRWLDLSSNGLDDGFVVQFVAAFPAVSFAGSLRVLDLTGNVITDAGANTLAAGRGLDALESLRLAGNRIGPNGQALLRHRFGSKVQL